MGERKKKPRIAPTVAELQSSDPPIDLYPTNRFSCSHRIFQTTIRFPPIDHAIRVLETITIFNVAGSSRLY